MEHDEIFEDTWEARGKDRLLYVKNDVLSTAFRYARYIMGMEELTNFSKKNSVTLLSLANKDFNSLRDENDELIYTYTDLFMRKFDRNSIKVGGCIPFNQDFKSQISDGVFIDISRKLNVNGNICDLLENYFEFLKQIWKTICKRLRFRVWGL